MNNDLYDEFGQYIGPELGLNELDFDDEEINNEDQDLDEDISVSNNNNTENNQIVLFEDKRFYPDANQVYKGVEVLVQEEDLEPLTKPIITPEQINLFDSSDSEKINLHYDANFLTGIMNNPELSRNIAVVGSLGHGKTSFVDLMVNITHSKKVSDKTKKSTFEKFTDTRKDEKERGMTIKSKPISLLLNNSSQKSCLINLFDTPGHSNFSDEVSSVLRIVEGVIFVVDAVEGITTQTKKILVEVIKQGLDIILCINKIDRLILELKIPPTDAYFKLKHTIDEFNLIIEQNSIYASQVSSCLEGEPKNRFVSPQTESVIFSSSLYNICFSLKSFTKLYIEDIFSKYSQNTITGIKDLSKSEKQISNLFKNSINKDDTDFISNCMWGDIYFINQLFTATKPKEEYGRSRTFIEFILEPIYKILGNVLSLEKSELETFTKEIKIQLTNKEITSDPDVLLKIVCLRKLFYPECFTDSVFKFISNPIEGNIQKIKLFYLGNRNNKFYNDIISKKKHNKQNDNESEKPLLIHLVKQYHSNDLKEFNVLGRVLSGVLTKNVSLEILGNRYSEFDKEDKSVKLASNLWIYQSRYQIEIDKAYEGSIVMIKGIYEHVAKSATAILERYSQENTCYSKYDKSDIESISILKPIDLFNTPYFKISVEPLNPTELPKMIEGLIKIDKSYSSCKTKVEETGEHTIIGSGELYLDCIMHDLRELYSNIEIKVSDPVVLFQETVSETSAFKCYSTSTNNKNKISIVSEPLDDGLEMDFENLNLNYYKNKNLLSEILEQDYKWNLLDIDNLWMINNKDLNQSSSNVISSNSSQNGINVLINHTLPYQTNQENLGSVRNFIERGFIWSCGEGPLLEEAVRNVKFKIFDAEISHDAVFRSGGQIMPMAKRSCSSSILLASPKILEPILFAEIMCPLDCVEVITTTVHKRRGHISAELPKPGTPFIVVYAELPGLDSFGFEVDVRNMTAGLAFVSTWFDHWGILPGDPLDRTIELKPLEPSAPPHLSREVLIKTRRKKGLVEDISILKYFDDRNLIDEILSNKDFKNYFG